MSEKYDIRIDADISAFEGDTTMNDELKPCPFCGSEATIHRVADKLEILESSCVGCSDEDCGIFVETTQSLGVAFEMWNRRPVEDTLRSERDALAEKWANVPWGALRDAIDFCHGPGISDDGLGDDLLDVLVFWLAANRPLEAAAK